MRSKPFATQYAIDIFSKPYLIDEAFRQHRKWREHPEELDYHTWTRDFKTRLAELLNTWQGHVGHAAGLLLRSLREKAQQWWYFLDHPSIPPDNNLAERSLRLAVTKRKVSGVPGQCLGLNKLLICYL
jgi:transposase